MTTERDDGERVMIEAAQAGDRGAFAQLIAPHSAGLRGFILRMVADPDDAEDLVQETLIQAHQRLGTFRGEARFSTWLFSIASRRAIDHLRWRKRWPREAQLLGHAAAHESEAFMASMQAATATPDFAYSAAEHMAFCFACVGRMLEPERAAALLLREVYELSNREGARALGISEPVFRHHVSDARRSMQEAYGGLCSLIGKQGLCDQCRELHEFCPAPRRGPAPVQLESRDDEASWAQRVERVRAADLADGTTRELHRVMFQLMAKLHG